MLKEIDSFNFKLTPNLRNINYNYIENGAKPKITVISIYTNEVESIKETQSSLLKQSFPYFEWIIVNSTGRESEILDNIKKQDKRVKILNLECSDTIELRYAAINEASCEIIFFIKPSDMIDNTLLECGYFTLLTNKNFNWAYSNTVKFGNVEELVSINFEPDKQKSQNLVPDNIFIRKNTLLEIKEDIIRNKEKYDNNWFLALLLISKGYYPIKMNYYGNWHKIENENNEKNNYEELLKDKTIKGIIENIDVKNDNSIQFPIRVTESMYYPYIFEFEENLKKETKNILFIVPWAVFGGADDFNLSFIKKLKEKKYKVTLIFTESHEYVLRPKFEEYADEIFDLSTFLNKKDWPAFIHYIIKTRNVDLIFQCNSMYGYHIIPWLKYQFPKLPIVDFLHNEQWEWRNGGYPRDSVAISNFLDMTYVCNKNLKNILYNDMGRKNKDVDVAYLGIDETKFDPDIVVEDEKLNEKYKGKEIVLFPCRLAYVKRPMLMIEILKQLSKSRENILFLVIGDGAAYDKMKEKVSEYNLDRHIEFLGYLKDIRPYYKIAKLTLICSLTEGITLTTYESLSMATPVVSSDAGGQREVVNDNVGKLIKIYQSLKYDEYNFNYSNEEVQEYVDAINNILDSKNYEQLKKNCRNEILDNYSSHKLMNQFIEKIDNIIINGSKVDDTYLNNYELALRYLVNFSEVQKLQDELKTNYEIIEERNKELYNQIVNNNSLKEKNLSLSNEIDKKSLELVAIKSSRSYKFCEKIRSIFKN